MAPLNFSSADYIDNADVNQSFDRILSASSALSADEESRKFSVTNCKSSAAELSDDDFQLQLPIYKKIKGMVRTLPHSTRCNE